MGSTHAKLISKLSDNTTDKLILTNQKLDNDFVKKLSKAILSNTVLQEICLEGSDVSPEAIGSITNSIARSSLNLTKLDLTNVSLGPTGAERLATELFSSDRRAMRLNSLLLNGCHLGDEGCSFILHALSVPCQCEILNLELASNNIKSAPNIKQLFTCNHSLHGLSLFDNHLDHTAITELASGLKTNSTLRWLSLGYNDLGSSVCGLLSNALASSSNSGLVWLGLGGNNIGDSGARLLSTWLRTANCLLYSLGLSSNLITVRGLQYIVKSISMEHSCVRSIGLSHNQLTDESCPLLASLLKHPPTSLGSIPEHSVSLTHLLISDNAISDNGIVHLAAALSECNSIQCLLLADNTITDQGLMQLGAALSLGNNTSLRHLDVQGCRISKDGEMDFLKLIDKRPAGLQFGCGKTTHMVQNIYRPTSAPIIDSPIQREKHSKNSRKLRFSFRKQDPPPTEFIV